MRQKKRVIGLLSICLLTVGIVSVYAQGGNPLDEVWDAITIIMSRIAALETRVDVLEECLPVPIGPGYILRHPDVVEVDEYPEIWVYVRNPSYTLERTEKPNSEPLHNVEVNSLTITIIDPNDEWRVTWIFYPNGTVIRSDPGGENPPGHIPEIERRIEPIIHPGETSLVYYGGWSPLLPGVTQFTYELNVEFEGTIYNLVKTVHIKCEP